MVRLKEVTDYYSRQMSLLFQFLHGAIKSFYFISDLEVDFYFNSFMVRLKVATFRF